MSSAELIRLAREAGLCVADCHFLDVDPYESLLDDLQVINNEEEREAYIELVKAEDGRRREKLQQLERFAGLILAAAQRELQRESEDWSQEYCHEVWVGAKKICNKLQWMAADCGVAMEAAQ
jgi:hypothetical protein